MTSPTNGSHHSDAVTSLRLTRRSLLSSAAIIFFGANSAYAETLSRGLPFVPNATNALTPSDYSGWKFFTRNEAPAIEAICNRLIPPDDSGPSGAEAGCAVFIDRQLAGPYGGSQGLYLQPPFMPGTPGQGYQGAEVPAAVYRNGLKEFEKYVATKFGAKNFVSMSPGDQDRALMDLEDGTAHFNGAVSPHIFFNTILTDTKAGYFADPIYGGNRDMASWRMIGFPGARYDYRDWVTRHNERYPLPPVSLMGRADWNRKG